MSKVIKLRRGLDIKLVGAADKVMLPSVSTRMFALRPHDFQGVAPKLLVQEGRSVKAGTPLFFDKARPELLLTSPVSGTVDSIVRGEKRRIEAIIIESDGAGDSENFGITDVSTASRESVTELLLKSGLWSVITQRPFGLIANHKDTPASIFVSGFDSAPLAPDTDFILRGEEKNLQVGFDALRKLTDGEVHIGLRDGSEGILSKISGVRKHIFIGAHPAGNVGIQINHIDPIRKGDVVWTVKIQDVALIGRLFNTGKIDLRRIIALTGASLSKPSYVEVVAGANIGEILAHENLAANARIIGGNVLTGSMENRASYLGFYDNQITVIPEGDDFELLGWIRPRLNKFSVSHSYFSWLTPRRKYNLNTNLNGGPRAFVTTDLYERYLPMDIYAIYLIKACMAGDIDKMENLGIYEVLPEDFALCEFVDPSKTEIQNAIQKGIDLMIKEMT